MEIDVKETRTNCVHNGDKMKQMKKNANVQMLIKMVREAARIK